jgi:predicted transcriptional regulator
MINLCYFLCRGVVLSKISPIKSIEKELAVSDAGLTIQQIMDSTNLARGTVKTYLDELIRMGRVHGEVYGQNTKVYFLNGYGKYQETVQMQKDGILFVDIMTDPWRKPFIRVKLKNKRDIGAIFLNNEKAVDELISALKKVKPQLQKYRDLIDDLESKKDA